MSPSPVYASPVSPVPEGLIPLFSRLATCRPRSACNVRGCPECQKRNMLKQWARIKKETRKANPRHIPQYVTLTVADVSVYANLRQSVQAVKSAAMSLFRSLPVSRAYLAAQISPSKQYVGFSRPHVHGLVWQAPEHSPEWLEGWHREIGRTGAELVAEGAKVEQAKSVEAVARYAFRGAMDLAEWNDRTDDLLEVINSLRGLRMFANVSN